MSDDTTDIRIPALDQALNIAVDAAAKAVKATIKWSGRMLLAGYCGIGVGLLMAFLAASNLATSGKMAEPWRQTLNSIGLAVCVAGIASVCSAMIITANRHSTRLAKLEMARLVMEPRVAVGQLAAQLESIVHLVTTLHEAHADHANGLRLLRADVQTLKDIQGDLERDLAALILAGKPDDSRVNGGSGGSVVSLRQVRPDGSG